MNMLTFAVNMISIIPANNTSTSCFKLSNAITKSYGINDCVSTLFSTTFRDVIFETKRGTYRYIIIGLFLLKLLLLIKV